MLRRLVVICAAAALSCAATPGPAPRPPPAPATARDKPLSPEPPAAKPGEAPLPTRCERASSKLALADALGSQGYAARARRLSEQAAALCPDKQRAARALLERDAAALVAAGKGIAATADALWAASRSASAAGDLPKARRLASLAAARFEQEGARVSTWTGVASVSAMALSRDGSSLLGRGEGGELLILDTKRLEPRVFLGELSASVEAAQFSPDGRTVALLERGSVVLYDTASGAQGKRLEWAEQPIQAFAFSVDGASVFTGARSGFDAVLRRFDVRTGDSAGEVVLPTVRSISALAVSPDGGTLAVASDRDVLTTFDAKKLTKLKVLGKAPQGVSATVLAFSPTGDRLASVSAATALDVWDVATGKALSHATLDRPWRATVLGFSGDGKRIRTTGGTWGEALADFDAATGQPLSSKTLPSGEQVLSPDAAVVAVSTRSGGLAIVDASSGKVTLERSRAPQRVEALAAADGHLALARVVRESGNDHVEVFVVGPRAEPARFFSVPGYKATLALSRFGQRLAGNFGGKSVRAWDVASGKPLELPDAPEWVDALHFAGTDTLRGAGGPFELQLFSLGFGDAAWRTEHKLRRGRRVLGLSDSRAATMTEDALLVLDVGKSAPLRLSPEKDTRALALSHDGKVLILVSARGTERLALPRGAPRELLSSRCTDGPAAVSADGTVVVARCSYKELALFAASGTVTRQAEAGHLALSPDGRVVVTERDGRVRIAGQDLKPRVTLELSALPGGVIARADSGELERFGQGSESDRPFCRAGKRAFPFELCEDVAYRDHLVLDALLGAP